MTVTRLQPVPDQPRRAVAYVRVSDEGDRGDDLLSPEIQLTAIRDHCARRGYELVAVLEDIDRSGRLWRRRQMEQAVQMVEDGRVEAVVVWKVSRVARNRKDWAIAVDRIESIGGVLESATEPMDTTTSTGRLTRGMLAELAAWESERMGETWKEVHQQRLSKGLPHYGPPRLGYSYDHEHGYTPNEQAPIVAEMYRRYIAGTGVGELVLWLRSEGVRVPKSGATRWTRYGMQYFLDSGFAAGLLQVHDPRCRCTKKSSCGNRVHIEGAHEAVIDQVTWQAYKSARERRRGAKIRSRIPVHNLAGLVICEGCRRPMQLQGSNSVPRSAYVCRTNRLAAIECSAPAWVRRDHVENMVRAWLADECAGELDALIESLPTVSVAAQRRDRLNRRASDLTVALGRLAADRALRDVPEAAYRVARDDLMRDLQTVSTELAALEAPVEQLRGLAEQLPGVLEVWDLRSAPEVNRVVKPLVRVVVSRENGPRVLGAWEWDG